MLYLSLLNVVFVDFTVVLTFSNHSQILHSPSGFIQFVSDSPGFAHR